jgi:ribosomal protein S18 acetylase RimI-like enzyme/catechol 2,3-dioxygenase-like lactoylglutathione lyase family enzyme
MGRRALPTATGLFEAHLPVGDLERSVRFYRDVVRLPLAHELPGREAAFLWIGRPGRAMLGLWSLGPPPVDLRLHIALAASLEDVLGACDALRSHGVTPLGFSGDETAEPSVIAWMPAAAVYFRDPDGHLVEHLAMLEAPARPEAGIVPWSEWERSAPAPVRVERHEGRRSELRASFEEAEDSAEQLDRYIDAGEVLVARAGERLVGHVQLVEGADGHTAEVKNIAVAAAHRGRGVGRALLAAALDRARAQGRSTVTVATATADVGALRFYQRAGFRMRAVERDAFVPATGYAADGEVDGVPLRDRIWLDLRLDEAR